MRKVRALIFCILIGMLSCGLTACGKEDSGTRVVFTTGFGKDEIFRIGNISCTRQEFMVYLTNTQNQYENVYGEEIWNIQVEDMTLEGNIKDTVLARLAQIKTMYLLALDRDIELSGEEEQQVAAAAAEYFASLNETEVEFMGATEEVIRTLYTEYAMANKVYETIIAGVNPEISDDEARTITVEHIMIKTYTTDGSGKRIEYSESMKASCYEKAREVWQLATDGEHDFTELAALYSDDTQIRYSFRKGESGQPFEEEAFLLNTGEVGTIIESEDGYHIIKCISTFDREETDANKLKIIEERKKEAFGEVFDSFVESQVRDLNVSAFQEITLIHDESVGTDDFFDVYHKYLD